VADLPYQDIAAPELPGFLERQNPVVLDMRDPVSFGRSHIPGAQPVSDALIYALRRFGACDRPLLVYCYHGISSRDLATLLARIGFTQVFNLEGGWQAWMHFRPGDTPAYSAQG
jgi:thiosulfate sulfurtransferase